MTKTNAELLAAVDTALKGIVEVSDLGDSILQPEKFDQFIRQIEDRTVVLDRARFIQMEAQQADVDRIGFTGRILKSGHAADGTTNRTLSDSEFSEPTPATNKLIAKELQAVASLRDKALRRNIERGGFESTLVDLFGGAAGRDLEEFALLADTNIAFADDDVLSQTDGWLRRSANKVYGVDKAGQVDRDFDPDASDFPENLFQSMLDSIPKKFLVDLSEWVIYVPFRILDAYRDRLRARGTALGDNQQVDRAVNSLPWKGLTVTYAPLLERAADVTGGEEETDVIEGEVAWLTNPNNSVWGVFHEVTIEQEREAKDRRTDWVLTIEADAHYEDENAAVTALVDKANPTAE